MAEAAHHFYPRSFLFSNNSFKPKQQTMKKLILISFAIASIAMLTVTTQSCKKTTTAANPTLYDTIGGLVTGTTVAGGGSAMVHADQVEQPCDPDRALC